MYRKLYSMLILYTLAVACSSIPHDPYSKKTLRVALCQILTLNGDRMGNLTRMEKALQEAKSFDARICCFPETCILGWVNPDAHKRAFSIPGKDVDQLCSLAHEYGVYLCAGLAEKAGEKLYDAAVLIDDQGRILLKHRKINVISKLMDPPYTPGESVKTVDTLFGKIGLLICADTFKEEILHRMTTLHPDLLLVPYGWAAPEESWPGHGKALHGVVSNTAQKTGAVVIGTDALGEIAHGPWRGQVYGGQSVVADRTGSIIAVAEDRDRDIFIVEIEIESTQEEGI